MPDFFKLKVHPDTKTDKILQKAPDYFEIWVKAPAERGLANASALGLLGDLLKKSPRKFRLVKGAHSSSKIVQAF